MASRHHKSSRGHSSSKAQGSSSNPTPSAPTWPPVSFLFIVNKLRTNDDPEVPGSVQAQYADGRWRPPNVIQGFLPQEPGYVFRWSNGTVSLAEGYHWAARPIGTPPYANGTIYTSGPGGTVWPQCFRAATVFFCNRFDQFFTARGDASTRDIATAEEPEDWWHPLAFRHENNISRVDHAGSHEHLAVRTATWINQLLPSAYRRESTHGPNHGGLAGLLPIVIALVAFSCINHNDLYNVLINDRAWVGHTWTAHQRPTGRMSKRGVVTTVFLDPENPQGSTYDTVQAVEEGNIPIFW